MQRNELERKAFDETGKNLILSLAKVCRDQGQHVQDRYGPKYRLIHKDLTIYVDDYGGYATVSFKGEMVLSNHFCDQSMVQGEWEVIAEEVLGIVPSFAGVNI